MGAAAYTIDAAAYAQNTTRQAKTRRIGLFWNSLQEKKGTLGKGAFLIGSDLKLASSLTLRVRGARILNFRNCGRNRGLRHQRGINHLDHCVGGHVLRL